MSADEVAVRYYAEAEEAAGCAEERIAVADGATVAELRRTLAARHGPQLAALLSTASILVDGVLARDEARSLGVAVDILPTAFAG